MPDRSAATSSNGSAIALRTRWNCQRPGILGNHPDKVIGEADHGHPCHDHRGAEGQPVSHPILRAPLRGPPEIYRRQRMRDKPPPVG